jgi:hypothetical protein
MRALWSALNVLPSPAMGAIWDEILLADIALKSPLALNEVHLIPVVLLPQKGAEQGEDAHQRDQRRQYTCQRTRQARAALMQ